MEIRDIQQPEAVADGILARRYLESHKIDSPTIYTEHRLLYSRKEAAYQLSVSVRALDYLIAERRLRSRKIGGRILIPYDELLRFARADRYEPITPGIQ